MNYKVVLKMNGILMLVDAAFMLLPLAVALIYKETAGFAFIPVILLLLCIGLPLFFIKSNHKEMYAREGFVIVSTAWIVMSFMGCLPFYISGEIPSLTDSFFETVSGFTTTGATILTDIEVLSNCMLFWRSFTHWAGGMGVLVFLLALAPLAGGNTMHLLRAESPGPKVEKFTPKITSTAKILYLIYTGITVLQVILLCLGKMPFFDALLTTFGTVGTGGFSTKNASIAYYGSYYLQSVVTVFMILCGINFNIYCFVLFRKKKQIFENEELRFYLGIIAAAVVLTALNTRQLFSGWYETLHHCAFQVASIISSTGFMTCDFDKWPQFSKFILLILTVFGACAGSTGGGIKISRVLIMFKFLKKELLAFIHPRSVKTIKLNGKKIDFETSKRVFVFLTCYLGILIVSVLLVSLDNFDLPTNLSAVLSMLSNTGPGLAAVGPTQNFSQFSVLSKFVLIADMLLGRLEIFPLLLLFAPDTWRKN